jgi:hypothetical protein
MIGLIILILIALWFFGYIHISAFTVPDIVLFSINGHPITLWNLLILAVIGWAIGILPSPFKQITSILLLLWILSVLGVITIVAGLSNILVIVIIIAILASLIL